MEKEELRKYLLWAIIALLILVSYFIIKPYLIAIVSAFILAYLVHPIFKRITPALGKSISAIVCIILILSVVILPIGLILTRLSQELSLSLTRSTLENTFQKFTELPIINSLNINSESTVRQLTSFVLSSIKDILVQIPTILISIAITILGIFYILKNWDKLAISLKNYLPFKDKNRVSKEIGTITKNILFGYLLIAIIEFAIALGGFYIARVEFFVLLALLIGLLAFFPLIGPILVWGPLSLYLLFQANYFSAIVIIITGLIISVGVDNFLAPKIVGQRAKINPFIMLIGILGGLSIFGLFGFVIGPLILVYTIKILEETVSSSP
jgi:predicted PurR-regulated permease PerM